MLSAIRKLVAEAADNGIIQLQLAAGIAHVRGIPRLGTRLGNWLSREQAERICCKWLTAGSGRRFVASVSCSDAVNLVDEPDLSDDVAFG
jgi:hypothetical protein